MTPTLLLYRDDTEDGKKLRSFFLRRRIRLRSVLPQEYGIPLGELCEKRSTLACPDTAGCDPFPEPMLVFAGFRDGVVSSLLHDMHREALPAVPRKAILTEESRHWHSVALYTALSTESALMQQDGRPALPVSACLLGIPCRYNGTGKVCEQILRLDGQFRLIPVCPETSGGLPVPREPAEQRSGEVFSRNGENVTERFKQGAEEVLQIVSELSCKTVILKERSPSCGSGTIYDGTFTGTLTSGDGILAGLLKANGIRVLGESEAESLMSDQITYSGPAEAPPKNQGKETE